jgi:hypothetical protein
LPSTVSKPIQILLDTITLTDYLGIFFIFAKIGGYLDEILDAKKANSSNKNKITNESKLPEAPKDEELELETIDVLSDEK